ncbi:MAG: hypothetical protein HKN25_16095 [Pyrinomonadaceae bacterium]|nr:hypothetical protein [Pyrinomonadaceae bacterium]
MSGKNAASGFLKLSLLVAIAFLSLNAAPAQERKLVESVDIQGNRRFKDQEIYQHITTRPGSELSRKQLEQDLARLLDLRIFYPAKTRVVIETGRRGGFDVIFEVRELPLIECVTYSISKPLSLNEIKNELRIHGLELLEGKPFRAEELNAARKVIESYLKRNDLANMDIMFYQTSLTATTIKLGITIRHRKK